jgi:hypothetical protein
MIENDVPVFLGGGIIIAFGDTDLKKSKSFINIMWHLYACRWPHRCHLVCDQRITHSTQRKWLLSSGPSNEVYGFTVGISEGGSVHRVVQMARTMATIVSKIFAPEVGAPSASFQSTGPRLQKYGHGLYHICVALP